MNHFAHAAVSVRPAVDLQDPWPGFLSYEETSQELFYGRREVTEVLFRQVKQRILTVLYGRSGLGKTSVLRAGLFPKLRQDRFLPIPIRLDFAEESPALVVQVKSAFSSALSVVGLASAELPSAEATLWEYFHSAKRALRALDGKPYIPVLVFDQFEELFALGRRRRPQFEQFLAELGDLVENRVPAELERRLEHDPGPLRDMFFEQQDYRVLISLREDYLGELESLQIRMPSIAGGRTRLIALNGEQALEAVVKPGRELVSDDVARQIVKYVAGPGGDGNSDRETLADLEVEPSLLSLVCRELNTQRVRAGLAQITIDVLAGSRHNILQDFYRNCIIDQPAAVRAFIEDELLTPTGVRDSVEIGRARRALAALGAADSVIDELVKRRLLCIEERLGVQRVELTHDVLVPVVMQSRDERQQFDAVQRARETEPLLPMHFRRQRRMLLTIVALMAATTSAFGGVAFHLYRVSQDRLREATNQRERADRLQHAIDQSERNTGVGQSRRSGNDR